MASQKLQFEALDPGWMEEQFLTNPMQIFSFLDSLYEPRFSIGQIGISRQELQYWRKNDLIGPIEKGDARTWVKVSFFDYCWLKLIAEMRKLFIPIDHIKMVKKVLFFFDKEAFIEQMKTDLEKIKNSGTASELTLEYIREAEEAENDPEIYKEAFKHSSYFIILLIDLLRRNSPATLIIDKNGISNMILLNEFNTPERFYDLMTVFDESFTSIRLNGLLDEFYINPRIKETHIQDIFKLSDKETKILSLLRKEGVKEVRVRIGSGGKGLVMVEVVEEKNINSVKEKIKAILDKEKVQNIKISNFEGNLLLFEETTKIKL